MGVTNATIARALVARLKSGAKMDVVSKSMASYLVEERRQGDVGAIIREVERTLLEQDGTLYVRVTAAHPLGTNQQTEIEQLFKAQSGAKKVIVEEIIDPSVIGGVRCETASASLDLTVRRQLQSLKGLKSQTV